MPSLRCFMVAAALMLTAVPVAGQSPQFRTPDEFRAEIARLDGIVVASTEAIASAETAIADTSDVIHRLLNGFVASRDTPVLGRLVAEREAMAARLLREQGRLTSARSQRQILLARYRDDLEPVWLREVTISFADPRDAEPQTLYSARWEFDPADRSIEDAVAMMASSLEGLDEIVAGLEEAYRQHEARFIAADRRWQARNADYITQAGAVTAATNTLLEMGDVTTSLLMAGPAWPAALAFEATYRSGEAIIRGTPESRLPRLPEEILAARDQAARYAGAGPSGDMEAPGSTLAVEELMQVGKSLTGGAYAGVAERVAQTAVPYFRDAAAAGQETRWHRLALLAMQPEAGPAELYRVLGGTSRAEGEAFAEMMRRAADPRAVDGALAYLRSPAFWRDFATGLGAGLLVTAVKEGVRDLNRQETQAIFEDLARLEIEWFVRRRALQSVNHLLQFHRAVQEGLVQALVFAQQQQHAAERNRHLAVASQRRLVLSPWQLEKGVRIDTQFSAQIMPARFGLGDGPLYPLTGTTGQWGTLGAELAAATGDLPLTIEVRPDAPWFLNDGFDADPASPARLLEDGNWFGREPGPERSHRLTFAPPEIAMLNPDPEAIAEGDTIELRIRAPSTLGEGAWIGVVSPAIAPLEMPRHIADTRLFANGGTVPVPARPDGFEGIVRLTARSAGNHEIRLYDRNRQGIAVLSMPLCVNAVSSELASDDNCRSLEDRWLWRWDHLPGRTFDWRIVRNAEGAYEFYPPPADPANEDYSFLCQRAGALLACRRRVQPTGWESTPDCPSGVKASWQPVEMRIDPGSERITGVFSGAFEIDTTNCVFITYDSPTAVNNFELVRDPDPPHAD